MGPTRSGQVLNAAQTVYANRVERILATTDPTEPPLQGAWIIWSMKNGWSPAECVAKGLELAL